MKQQLLPLASRVEELDCPSTIIDKEIFNATNTEELEAFWYDHLDGWYIKEQGMDDFDFLSDFDRFYTASLDAAVSLVPEGLSYGLRSSGTGDKGQATIWNPSKAPHLQDEIRVYNCCNPAVALSAASLRAIASEIE